MQRTTRRLTFVTSDTWERRALFRTESWARLFFKALLSHRGEAYLLHAFVLMPDHFHLLISPSEALEPVVQLIKGGFSYRAKKELGSNAEIWQRGFADHRIRDAEDYEHAPALHLSEPDEEASMCLANRLQVLIRISRLEVRPHPSGAKALDR